MDDREALVCYGCLEDPHLEKLILNERILGECSYCHRKCEVIGISRLADLVAELIRKFLIPSSDYDRGDGLDYHVADILGCDEDCRLVKDVCAELTACSYYDRKNGGESRFNDEDLFTVKQLRPVQAERKWNEFRTGIMHKSRFFNQGGKDFLIWLFKNIDSFQTYRRPGSFSHAVRTIKKCDGEKLFRARLCDSPGDLTRILEDPSAQMSAPPKDLATAGRMNPEGVPVFYGAFDRETCIAELRPPVGGSVISGEFRLTRDVRVLDFKVLEEAYEHAPISMFDPEYRLKQERRRFLRTFHSKISSPVLPKQEREYLTTQVIAEYLSTQHTPRIDGVIFSSVQKKDGLNIVLFTHVVTVEHPAVRLTPRRLINKTSGIEFVSETMVLHKIEAVKFTPTDLKVIGKDLEWIPDEPEYDDDWD